jgi:hypothetical protein
MGLKRLDFREYLREAINMAQGRGAVGFRDAGALWYVHHHITDRKAWDDHVTSKIINTSTLATPSETQGLFEKGYGCAMTCFLGEKDAMCLWSTPTDATKEDYQGVVNRFTNGGSINSVHKIDTANSAGLTNISKDQWAQDMHSFAKAKAKAAPEVQADEGASQPILTQ